MTSRRSAAALFTGLLCLCVAVPADAALRVLPAPGSAFYLRVTETTEALAGPQSSTTELSVRCRSADAALIEEGTSVWIARVLPDGTVQLNEGPLAAASDTSLVATLAILDQAQSIANGERTGTLGWSAAFPLPPAGGAEATPAPPVMIPIQASASGNDYDIAGQAQVTAPVAREPEEAGDDAGGDSGEGGGDSRGGGGGFPGGGGGGYGGGRHWGSGGAGGRRFGTQGERPSPTLTIAVAGHVAAGSLSRLTVTQTRTLVLGGLPYANVSSWTVEVIRTTHLQPAN